MSKSKAILAAILLVAVGAVVGPYVESRVSGQGKSQYHVLEYSVNRSVEVGGLEQALSNLGAQGWRLVDANGTLYVFEK